MKPIITFPYCAIGTSLKNNETAEQVLSTVSENPSGVRGENPSILFQDPEFMQTHVSHQQDNTEECHHDSHLPLASQAISNLGDTESFPYMPIRSKISRLEVQAALNLSVNILPFWLCTLPVSCNTIALYWCIRLDVNFDNFMEILIFFGTSLCFTVFIIQSCTWPPVRNFRELFFASQISCPKNLVLLHASNF
jgi:hypothetical protein